MFTAVSHWSGSRVLAHHHHLTLIETPLGEPTLSCERRMVGYHFLQDQSFHEFRRVIDGTDIRVGQPKAQDVGLGSR